MRAYQCILHYILVTNRENTMNIQQAIKRAKDNAKKSGDWIYVVKTENGDYDIASEYDLDTFYLGSNPRYAVGPDGEVN